MNRAATLAKASDWSTLANAGDLLSWKVRKCLKANKKNKIKIRN